MHAGEGEAAHRYPPRRTEAARRVALPALVLALTVFCVQGLQLVSSIVRQDLASPPLVEVPPIDLGSSPPPRPAGPDRTGSTAAAERAPADAGDPPEALALALAGPTVASVGPGRGATVETLAVATIEVLATGVVAAGSSAPAAILEPLPDAGEVLVSVSAAVAEDPVPPPGEAVIPVSASPRVIPTSASPRARASAPARTLRPKSRTASATERAPRRAVVRSDDAPHGPPPGRPVGPACEDKPGRRAACDRRPPKG